MLTGRNRRLPAPRDIRRAGSQRGVILLEALVAVLVFSVGVIALLALQASSITMTRDAKLRADASLIANEIIGLMWADKDNLASYQHFGSGGAAAGAVGAAACTPGGAASANARVTAWLARATAALPGTTANRFQIAVQPSNVVTVSVCWRSPADNAMRSFSTTAQING